MNISHDDSGTGIPLPASDPQPFAFAFGAGWRRLALGSSAALTICAGLLVHFTGHGFVADFAGDALYAVLVYLLVAFVGLRVPTRIRALVAFALCAAIEFLQLTGVPEAAAQAFSPAALLLGSGFSAIDLLAYALGVALAATADVVARAALTRPRRAT